MNLFERSFNSITRNKGKNMLLLLLVAGLGTIMSGAIVLNQSINHARNSLWRQLPPVVVIDKDIEAISESENSFERILLTEEILEPIVNLPYVQSFDFFDGLSVFSRELERVPINVPYDLDGENPVIAVDLEGITNPNIMRIETGIYDLVAGRVFTEEDMIMSDERHSVAMISRALAEFNGLEIGSIITIENNFYQHSLLEYEHLWGQNLDEYIMEQEIYTFEIIGLFEPNFIARFGDEWDYHMLEMHVNNGIYVPLQVVHSMWDFVYMNWYVYGIENELFTASETLPRNIILLYDAADVPSFIETAEEFLPPYYKVATFSNSVIAIERLDDSLDLFQGLSEQIIWISAGATALSLGLVVLLFVRDRKGEVGIYLALGDKKANIIKQMLIELLVPSLLGITLALFSGNLVANQIGREMLINDIIARQDFDLGDYGWSEAGAQLQWFVDDGIDTLVENYDMSLGMTEIALFYGISITVVLISTTLPITYLMRLSPKEILVKGID